MMTPEPATTDHRPPRERRSRTSASTSNRYLRSSTIGPAIPTAANAAADGSRGMGTRSASLPELSAMNQIPVRLRRSPAPRAQPENDAGEDPEQPAENRGRED